MAKKTIVLLGVALLAAVVIFAIANGPDIVNTRIVLSGPAESEITGSYTADGKDHGIEGTLPMELSIDIKRLSLSLESSETISAEVFVNDKRRVSGRQRHIQIEVTGNTMLSSTPRVHLTASAGNTP